MNRLRRLILIAACFLAAEHPSSAQTPTGVSFLLFPSSPETYAMGGMSSGLQFTHPMAAVGNPAQMGFMSREGILTAGLFMPTSEYLPAYQLPDASYSTTAINAAMDMNDLAGFPLSVGLGYSRNYMNWGEFQITNSSGPSVVDKFESHESSNNISLGAGLDYWVKLGAGGTIRFVNSHLTPLGTEPEKGEGSASVTAYDIGLLLTIPTVHIAGKAGLDLAIPSAHLAPLFDLTLGFAKNNIGDKVTYIDPAQGDPLPRQASLGAGMEAGIISTAVPGGWRLLTAAYLHESNDLLVRRNGDGSWEYIPGAGNIDFIHDVIAGKDNPATTQRKGWKIDIGEVLSLRGGSVQEPRDVYDYRLYRTGYTTSGFGVRLSGLWKALYALGAEDNHPWMTFMREKFDLRYDYCTSLYPHDTDGISFGSLSLVVKQMPF